MCRGWAVAGAALLLIGTAPVATAGGPLPAGARDTTGGLNDLDQELTVTVVRPGVEIVTQFGGAKGEEAMTCTVAFLFESRGRTYASTAGHCVQDASGFQFVTGVGNNFPLEQVWGEGEGNPVYLADHSHSPGKWSPDDAEHRGVRIGETVYGAYSERWAVAHPDFDTLPPYIDFGLVRLDRGVSFDPAVCWFGGPVGVRAVGSAPDRFLAHMYGQGVLVSRDSLTHLPASSARTALVSAVDEYHLQQSFVVSSGDSGSPVLDGQGQAVAVLGNVGLAGHLSVAVARAEHVLDQRLRLLTAPWREADPFGADEECSYSKLNLPALDAPPD